MIDLLKNPQLAKGDQIIAIPTLVRKLPEPMRKIIGDLSNTVRVLVGLDLRPRKGRGITWRRNKTVRRRRPWRPRPGRRTPAVRAAPVRGRHHAALARKPFATSRRSARSTSRAATTWRSSTSTSSPTLAKGEQIIAAPTLIKKLPLPLRRLIGNMADKEKVLVGLDLRDQGR